MSRHNLAFLTGAVLNKPIIVKNDDGSYVYGMCFINVVRGFRDAGDHKNFMKSDNPIIMTREISVLEEMENWDTNDIVFIKGVIAAKSLQKTSNCPHCEQKNSAEGTLVYINPIFARKEASCETQEAAMNYLSSIREISNQVYLLGTLCRDPKKIKPKEGLIVTQYQIALNRKYFIRSDPPEIKTDYPWVKSYGDNAVSDREHLHTGSVVFIDGCIQARNVQRHLTCPNCGEDYIWKDRAMEIVPYETEYMRNFYSDEEIEENKRKQRENAIHSIFGGDTEDGDEIEQEDIDAGIDGLEDM